MTIDDIDIYRAATADAVAATRDPKKTQRHKNAASAHLPRTD